MGVGIFLILFILGMILSTAGGLIGLVDAFRVSPTWGLLSLFVPFALLVFCIKFWGSRKWAKISLMTTMAGLLSMLAGVPFMAGFLRQQMAGLEGQPGDVAIEPLPSDQDPLDQIPIDQQPIDQVPVDQVPVEGDPNFTTPMVPAAPQLANAARADLIQSTDPDERVRQINNRRPDPFATVPIPPPPVVTPPPPPAPVPAASPQPGVPAAPTATAPGAPSPRRPAAAPGGASPTRPGGATTPGAAPGTTPGTTPGARPGARPGQPGQPPVALAPLPTLPEPTQALEVVVTGVVTIGDRTYAIVQSPSEPTGRYVMAGQRVAGGSVLVKRIDMRGSEPIVVLEQNGVELSRSVGLPEEEEEESAAT